MGVIESLGDGKGSEGQNLLPHLLVLVLGTFKGLLLLLLCQGLKQPNIYLDVMYSK